MAISVKGLGFTALSGVTLAGAVWLGASNIEAIRDNVTVLTDTIETLVTESHEFVANHNIFRGNAETAISGLQAEIADAQEEIEGLEADYAYVSRRLRAALFLAEWKLDEYNAAQARVTDLTAQVNSLTDTNAGLTAELATATATVGRLETEIADAKAEIAALEADYAYVSRRLTAALFLAEWKLDEYNAAQARVAELTSQNESLIGENASLVSELDRANEAIRNLDAEIQAAVDAAYAEFQTRSTPEAISTELN